MLAAGSAFRPAFSGGHLPRRLQCLLAGSSRRTPIFSWFRFHNVPLEITGLVAKNGHVPDKTPARLVSMGMIIFVLLTIILFVARFSPVLVRLRRPLAALLRAVLPLFTGLLVRTAGGAEITLAGLLVFIGALDGRTVLVRTLTKLIARLLSRLLTGLLRLIWTLVRPLVCALIRALTGLRVTLLMALLVGSLIGPLFCLLAGYGLCFHNKMPGVLPVLMVPGLKSIGPATN